MKMMLRICRMRKSFLLTAGSCSSSLLCISIISCFSVSCQFFFKQTEDGVLAVDGLLAELAVEAVEVGALLVESGLVGDPFFGGVCRLCRSAHVIPVCDAAEAYVDTV